MTEPANTGPLVLVVEDEPQVRRFLRNHRNRLDAGGAGTDHRNPLALEADGLMRPVACMVFLALVVG